MCRHVGAKATRPGPLLRAASPGREQVRPRVRDLPGGRRRLRVRASDPGRRRRSPRAIAGACAARLGRCFPTDPWAPLVRTAGNRRAAERRPAWHPQPERSSGPVAACAWRPPPRSCSPRSPPLPPPRWCPRCRPDPMPTPPAPPPSAPRGQAAAPRPRSAAAPRSPCSCSGRAASPGSTRPAPSATTTSSKINNRGQIVGATCTSPCQQTHGFLLRDGASGPFTPIDVPGGAGHRATGINDAGTIVGNYTNPMARPVRNQPTLMGRMA
jgi:hypothetical protein